MALFITYMSISFGLFFLIPYLYVRIGVAIDKRKASYEKALGDAAEHRRKNTWSVKEPCMFPEKPLARPPAWVMDKAKYVDAIKDFE